MDTMDCSAANIIESRKSVCSSSSSSTRRRAELRRAHLLKRQEMERRKEEHERQTADLSREIEFHDAQHEVECEELLDDGVASNRSFSRERTLEYVNTLPEVDVTRSAATTRPEINMDKDLCENIRTVTFN